MARREASTAHVSHRGAGTVIRAPGCATAIRAVGTKRWGCARGGHGGVRRSAAVQEHVEQGRVRLCGCALAAYRSFL